MNLRNTLTASAAAVALMAGSSAQAGDYYFSLFGGISTFDDEIEFQQSQSNSLNLGSHYVSRVTLAGGPLPAFTLKTVVPTLTFIYTYTGYTGPYSSIAVGTLTPTVTFVPFSTTRNVGNYKIVGSRFDATSLAHNSNFNWQDDFGTGFVVGAAFGAEITEGWRAELELAYRKADVDSGGRYAGDINGKIYQNISFPYATNYVYRAYNYFNGGLYTVTGAFTNTFVTITGLPVSTGTASTSVLAAVIPGYGPIPYASLTFPNAATFGGNFSSDGEAQVWSLMANLWYDFDFMGLNPDGINTFFGGGVGVAQLDLEYNASMGTYFGGTIGYGLDDSGIGFAYQLGAGIGFDMGNGMMLSAQYRWFGTSDIDLGATDMRVESHNALIGLQIPLGNLSM